MEITLRKSTVTLCHGDIPIGELIFSTPIFKDGQGAKRLSKYYARVEKTITEHLKSYQAPLTYPISVEYTIATNSENTISLYCDIRYGNDRFRISDTWRSGYPITPKALGIKRRDILSAINKQAKILSRSGYILLHSDFEKRIRRYYNPKSFYLKDGEPMIFFQPGTLADKAYGILEFSSISS